MRRFEAWRNGTQVAEGVEFSDESVAICWIPAGLRFTYNRGDLYLTNLHHDNDIRWIDPKEDDESSEAHDA